MLFRLWVPFALCLSGVLASAAQPGDPELAARCSLTDEIVVEECVEALKDAESVSDPYMRKLHLERAIKAMEARARELAVSALTPASMTTAPAAELDLPEIYRRDRLPRQLEVADILKLLQQLRPEPAKGEFETSAAFEARRSAWEARPFKGRPSGAEVFAFDVRQGAGKRGLQLTYDADRQEIRVELALELDTPAPGAWLETFFAATRIAVRNARTVMGVPFRVETWRFSSMGLSVRPAVGSLSMPIPMPTALAQSVKPHLRALAVVRLEAPFAVHEVQTKTASLDSPTESRFAYLGLHAIPLALLLYDPRDGRVYARRVGRF